MLDRFFRVLNNALVFLSLLLLPIFSISDETGTSKSMYYLTYGGGLVRDEGRSGVLASLDVSRLNQSWMMSYYGNGYFAGNSGCLLIECTGAGEQTKIESGWDLGIAYGPAFQFERSSLFAQIGAGYGLYELDIRQYSEKDSLGEFDLFIDQQKVRRTPHLTVRVGVNLNDRSDTLGFEAHYKVDRFQSYVGLLVRFGWGAQLRR